MTAFDGVTVIVHEGVIVGALDRLTQAHTETSETSGAVGQSYIVVNPHTDLVRALRALHAAGAELAIVCTHTGSNRAEHIVGVMTARDIVAALERTAQLIERSGSSVNRL